MPKLLQMDFAFEGPFGDEMAEALKDLANSIVEEPGFMWKVWTENAEAKEAGGIYVFDNEENAKAYLEMHTERLKGFGITEVNAKVFDVNGALSKITKAKLD